MPTKRVLVSWLFAVASPAFGQATVGVKNFRQLNASYAAITGVDPSDPDISSYFELSKTRLPKLGRVNEVSSPMLLTAAALGGLYCQKMIANDATLAAPQRRANKQVDFTKTPAAALTDPVQKNVIDEYARMFWRRSPTTTESETLVGVFAQSLTVTTPDTQKSLTLVCSAVAASLDTLVN